MWEKFTYTFGPEQYKQCYASLKAIMKDFDIYQYLIDNCPEYFLSQKDKTIFLELLVNGSLKIEFCSNISSDIFNTLMLAESWSFAEWYGSDRMDILFNAKGKKKPCEYEIFLDGTYGILIKNKDNIPLCVLWFDVNEDALMVRQIQWINNNMTKKIHRDINRFVRRKLLIQAITILAKKLWKNRIFYQKSEYNHRDKAKNNIKWYDNVFREIGCKEEEKSFISDI